jgi:MFS family permease
MSRSPETHVRAARDAVSVVFALNGFAFATWVARIPEVRAGLELTPGQLGTLLLALSVGAVVSLPTAGFWVQRFGPGRVVAAGALLDAAGLAVVGVGADALTTVWVAALGLLALGYGAGTWDVAMNVEGADVERRLGYTVMPRFHAAFSLGTVAGAGAGAVAAWLGVPVVVHLGSVAVTVALLPAAAVRRFLPLDPSEHTAVGGATHLLRAWSEPRTLAIGGLVLALSLAEGVANDWLAVALVDGYGVEPWLGAAGFALFVSAMTAGRLVGGSLLDRFGRVPVLRATMAAAAVGVLAVVLGASPVVVAGGIVLWGLGASLGFPVGMSAAADEPSRAAARVSVVSTIGYTAFLAGPPALGFLGDQVGVLAALLLVAALLVPSVLAAPAVRRPAAVRAAQPMSPSDDGEYRGRA